MDKTRSEFVKDMAKTRSEFVKDLMKTRSEFVQIWLSERLCFISLCIKTTEYKDCLMLLWKSISAFKVAALDWLHKVGGGGWCVATKCLKMWKTLSVSTFWEYPYHIIEQVSLAEEKL